LTPSELKEV